MTKNDEKPWRIVYGKTMPMGITREGRITYFSVVMESSSDSYLHIYEKGSKEKLLTVPLKEEYRLGDVFTLGIENLPEVGLEYTYESGHKEYVDEWAKKISGRSIWGEGKSEQSTRLRGVLDQSQFDWGDDKKPMLTYEEMILYRLHVRGFTKHASSKVKHKGTYLGVMEKLPYLKNLGINAIELLPAYEFNEVIQTGNASNRTTGYQAFLQQQKLEEPSTNKVNYWGYTKDAFYMAPKASYSDQNPDKEFKRMVKECHKSGIEVIMEFYFEQGTNPLTILACFHHWTQEYHVDGFHFNSNGISANLVAADPYLTKVKLMTDYVDTHAIYAYKIPQYENMAIYNDNFQTDMRRFLKGDEEHTSKFGFQFKSKPAKIGKINYMTNTNGFTLADLYSYDVKHNQANGEDNKDGTEYNYSWNCGKEGVSRSKKVLEQRQKQLRNALVTLFMSQGTPMLLAGDEFLNSQNGNNNAYCQDNDVTWLNWNQLKSNAWLYEFVKEMIALRKEHPILHRSEEFRLMDYISCGCPDLSFHGTKAWYPDYSNYSRVLGVMLCGQYVRKSRQEYDESFYFAYNMHWEGHTFDLPSPPKGKKWQILVDTSQPVDSKVVNEELKKESVPIKPRSIVVFETKSVK